MLFYRLLQQAVDTRPSPPEGSDRRL